MSVLTETQLPDPEPGPGQITIDTSHAAVGLIDVLLRRGDMAKRPGLPQPPFVPGLEVAGTVRQLGNGVEGFHVGEPVVTVSQMALGGYASVTVAEASMVLSLSDSDVNPALAVAALPNATTAYLALTRVAHLQQGESVLVHGAAIDALGIDQCHLVVHDIGGPIGFERAITHPERVLSLTVLNSPVDVAVFRRPWPMHLSSSTASVRHG
jgi:D-arabinose 1-dehydrogenase-like Zn-dependent alcohol dehydrogenase